MELTPVASPSPEEAVRRLVSSAYRAAAAGDAEALSSLVTADALVWGIGPADAFTSREALATFLSRALLPVSLGDGGGLTVRRSSPVVGLGADARSGWVADFPVVDLGGEAYLPRITGHVVASGGGRFLFDALHVSLPVADERLVPPRGAPGLAAPVPVDPSLGPGTEELAGLTRRLLADFEVKVRRTSPREAFVQVGTAPAEVFVGGAGFRALAEPQLSAIRSGGYRWRLDGPLGARRTGDTGWTAGHVVLTVGAGKQQQVYPPFRTLWVLVEEGGVWNVAQEHQSLPVVEDARVPATADELSRPRPGPATPDLPAGDGGSPIGVW